MGFIDNNLIDTDVFELLYGVRSDHLLRRGIEECQLIQMGQHIPLLCLCQ